MGIKKARSQGWTAEKKQLLALHPELKWLQNKLDNAAQSAGIDRNKRLESLRKVLESEKNSFDIESRNITKLIDLLRQTTLADTKKGDEK